MGERNPKISHYSLFYAFPDSAACFFCVKQDLNFEPETFIKQDLNLVWPIKLCSGSLNSSLPVFGADTESLIFKQTKDCWWQECIKNCLESWRCDYTCNIYKKFHSWAKYLISTLSFLWRFKFVKTVFIFKYSATRLSLTTWRPIVIKVHTLNTKS